MNIQRRANKSYAETPLTAMSAACSAVLILGSCWSALCAQETPALRRPLEKELSEIEENYRGAVREAFTKHIASLQEKMKEATMRGDLTNALEMKNEIMWAEAERDSRMQRPSVLEYNFTEVATLKDFVIRGEGVALNGEGLKIERDSAVVLKAYFPGTSIVTIRAEAGAGDARIGIGGLSMIVNSNIGKSLLYWKGNRIEAPVPKLAHGQSLTISVLNNEDSISVVVNGKRIAHLSGKIKGTVCIWPKSNSHTNVKQLKVKGDIDLDYVVTGPSHRYEHFGLSW